MGLVGTHRMATWQNNVQSFWTILLFLISILILCVQSGTQCPHRCVCDVKTGQVNCSRLSLDVIPADLPGYTTSLILSLNLITEVPPGVFSHLKYLKSVDLSSNKLTDASIYRDSLTGFSYFDTLDLSYNMFSEVPKGLPSNVTYFYLIQNKLRIVMDDFFENMSIFHLDLSNNPITGIQSDGFSPLAGSLVELYLEFNELTDGQLPTDVFPRLTKLKLLGLRFSHLAKIPSKLPLSLQSLDMVGTRLIRIPRGVLNHLTNLHDFSSWQSPLTDIEDNAFSGLTRLSLVDLNSMRLEKITNNTFAGLPGLKTLYLYSNNISEIAPSAFDSFLQPRELWLSGNRLQTLHINLLKVFSSPSMDFVDLTFNPWWCDCNLRWLKELQEVSGVISSPHLITCHGPASVRDKAWDSITAADFVCD